MQAAAAARIVGEPDICGAATGADGTLVFCHLVVDCDRVNYGRGQDTPLHVYAERGHPENCRILLLCKADVLAKNAG